MFAGLEHLAVVANQTIQIFTAHNFLNMLGNKI